MHLLQALGKDQYFSSLYHQSLAYSSPTWSASLMSVSWLPFHCCEESPEQNFLWKQRFVFANGFWGFSPLPVGLVALRLLVKWKHRGRKYTMEGWGRGPLFTSIAARKWRESWRQNTVFKDMASVTCFLLLDPTSEFPFNYWLNSELIHGWGQGPHDPGFPLGRISEHCCF